MAKDRRIRWVLCIFLAAVLVLVRCRSKEEPTKPGDTFTNSVGMEFVCVPAGGFLMGSPDDEPKRASDEFQHKVIISQPFRIGTKEVTQKQWQAVMGNNPSNFQSQDLPVEKVSWKNAVTFCEKLSEKEGKTYRLPTEAEWEYACRGGSAQPYAGTGNLDDMGWYDDNSEDMTHSVGTKQANAWGIHDMHGNVAEWCSDFYDAQYPQQEVTDPTGPAEGTYRVVRGGSWSSFAPSARCAARTSMPASYQVKQTGFRVVMEISE